ncbi:MAG TPA: B12-binding domain-containing radical SAM protein [Spirochaetota bacterium]|nr:B12-binding domain-containing radical SAM protein [Spirochaetota bacterium]
MIQTKRIVFIQLPLINHSYDYIQGNMEYASASIGGYILNNITKDIEIHNLPTVLTQFGSDSLIVTYIMNVKPDIVAFTCFLWNVERSIAIAESIKQQDGSIRIIIGGSEIYPGSIALAEKSDCIDHFVSGEGEWFFHKLLSHDEMRNYEQVINGNRVVVQPADELLPVEEIFEPLSGMRLNPMPDGSAFFELTRGCPHKCSYCLYSKNFNRIRELPFELLVNILTDQRHAGRLSELYILSPALNNTKQFLRNVELLTRISNRIRLHSEMRAGGIDEATAELLYKAGFRSMEVGLQTTNMASLDRVGRNSRPDREIEGMRHLKNAGIDIKIGLMPGLPGDTKESFLAMADMLIESGFKENIELYPLMILPGTLIRDQAHAGGINYLKKPPYYYNYGWGTSFDDLRDITRYMEDATGFTHVVRRLPDFNIHDDGLFCRGLCIQSDDLLLWDDAYIDCIETNVFDYSIQVRNEQELYDGLPGLIRHLPDHELFNIILYGNTTLEERIIIDLTKTMEKDNFIRRINIFHDWKDGCRLRFYQVLNKYDRYRRAKETYSFITPVFQVTRENSGDLKLIDDYEDNILIAKGAFAAVKRYSKKFADATESVAFEDPSEQKEFYAMIGHDYIQLPYTFKVARYQGRR